MVYQIVFSVVLYVVFLVVISFLNLDEKSYLVMALSGFILVLIETVVSQFLIVMVLKKRNRGAYVLFRRFMEGDLSLSHDWVRRSAHSSRLGLGFLYLAQGIMRLLNRFSSLAIGTHQTSMHLVEIGNTMAEVSMEGTSSLQVTSEALEDVFASQDKLHLSVERLSVASEDTSSSILEMGASLEEVTNFSKTLTEQMAEVLTHVENSFSSLKDLQGHVSHLSQFGVETASSMQQMEASVTEANRNAQMTAKKAEESRTVAHQGKALMEGMVRTVEDVQEEMQSLHETMSGLEDKTLQIGDVVKVITDITKQTNLLALNAAIIAAQGREKGKGFAVVADEIRDLSERTAHSTDEIHKLITGIQDATKALARQLNLGIDKIAHSVSTTHEVSARFDDIMGGLQASLDAVDQIADMMGEQKKSSSSVASAVEEVSNRLQMMQEVIVKEVKEMGVVRDASRSVQEGVGHILRSTEEQKKGAGVIQEALSNVRVGIDDLVEASRYIRGSGQKILQAVDTLKQSMGDVSNMASSVRISSESIYTGAQNLRTLVGEFKRPDPIHGKGAVCYIPWKGEYRFDPISTRYMATGNVLRHIYETLVDFQSSTLPIPLLATSWDVEQGGLIYNFHIKQGVLFHSGKTMTSRDVLASFHRALHPTSPSLNKGLFECITGAAEFISGEASSIAGIETPDAATVRFTLTHPLAIFPTLLSMNDTAIIPEEAAQGSASNSILDGTGPFTIEEIVRERAVRLKRFKGYHGDPLPYLDALTIDIQPRSPESLRDAFKAGDIDLAMDASVRDIEMLGEEGYFYVKVPTLRTTFIAFNQAFEPLRSREVRQALNHAVDRERINRVLFGGRATLANGLLPGPFQPLRTMQGYPFNPEKSRSLMQEAGYGDGLRLSLWVKEGEDLKTTPIPWIVDDLKEIGVYVDIETLPQEVIQSRRRKGEQSALYLTGWYSDFPDPDSFFSSLLLPETDAVHLHFENEEIIRDVHMARVETNTHRRQTLIMDLNRRISQEAPVLFLFNPNEFVIHQPKIMDVTPAMVPPLVRLSSIWKQD